VDGFDAERLGNLLERSIVSLGVPQALDRVVAPLLGEIGRRWRSGRLGVAHEHLATAVVRRVLGWVMASATVDPGAPGLVVATPSRQVHELGAMMVAAAAAAEGWRIAYLGADLPVREVALAADRIRADAVALSVVAPVDVAVSGRELAELRGLLPAPMPLLVGGGGAAVLGMAADAAGARVITDLAGFRAELRAIALARAESQGTTRNLT
jgi:methanogenic corrinoid protein MtbC1